MAYLTLQVVYRSYRTDSAIDTLIAYAISTGMSKELVTYVRSDSWSRAVDMVRVSVHCTHSRLALKRRN